MEGQWLRWYDQSGNWILTGQENKLQANQRADQQQQRADLLASKIRSMGINVDEL
jgi:hypothetical protein